jgi:hypothetical protein
MCPGHFIMGPVSQETADAYIAASGNPPALASYETQPAGTGTVNVMFVHDYDCEN